MQKTVTPGKGGKAFTILIDEVDEQIFNSHKWHMHNCGYATTHIRRIDGRQTKTYLHRLIMGSPKDAYIDHIDGNCLNNQRNNLRICNASENARNQKIRVDNKTGFKGVSYYKEWNKFKARIMIHGKEKHLGLFLTAQEAVIAYNEAAKLYHGEFAKLNSI